MSDISRELVKCAKCGKESQQLIVYSVNYYLEGKENGDKLLYHKQKCPYCNYEAIDISENKLTRKELADKFYGYHSKNKINSSDLTINYLNELQDYLNDYDYENDIDFIMGGRKKIVYDEIIDILNGNKNVDNPLYFILGSLEEFMCNQNQIYSEDVDKNKWENGVIDGNDIKELRDKNDRYSNKGIICLEEKKYINNIIEEIKKYIKNLEDNDMGLFSKKDKYEINEKDNVPYEVYGIPDFKKKNYDVKPEENVPQRVYGVPNAMLNNNNDKYDIKPENNVPQRVYGVPNTNIPKPSNNSVIKKSVGVSIKNEKSNYVLSINYAEKLGTYDLLFADLNNLENKSISDLATPVPEKYYTDFITKLYSIINDWENNYSGDSNVSWNIKIDDENNQKTISGKGGFPKNWNKLIDLLSEYERLFKISKDIELGKIQDMKDAKLSFEEVVRNKVSDPFWVETIVKHFKEEEKMNDVVSKTLFKDLSKYDDILNEFTKYLTQRTYDIDDAIEINGYTAKKVAELNPAFHATGVYTFMELLRDDFNKAEEIIKGGFKNKDVVPPINQLNVKTEEEMLKEIEDEVDQEMIKEGLLRIENGRKIPSFGSIHTRWAIEKRILKERYNYDYKTPAEKNPFTNYD